MAKASRLVTALSMETVMSLWFQVHRSTPAIRREAPMAFITFVFLVAG
jgi:hypothetical protein